jgi:hypothetical protein
VKEVIKVIIKVMALFLHHAMGNFQVLLGYFCNKSFAACYLTSTAKPSASGVLNPVAMLWPQPRV